MVATVASEIQNLRAYLNMPIEDVPDDWRVFVQEYHRQKADAERMAVSDDPDLRRRGRRMLENLGKML